MNKFPAPEHGKNAVADARRERALGTALAELALTVSLILSIAVIVAVAGASSVMAQARTDLIMMEETSSTAFTTMGIVAVIIVVMGVLTILALRDVAPAHSKRGRRQVRR
jgi:heme/copper-type cytochrome/quinol oxidase subunit 2